VLSIGKGEFLVSSGVNTFMPSAALVILCQCFKMICSMTYCFASVWRYVSVTQWMVMLNVRITVESLWEFVTILKPDLPSKYRCCPLPHLMAAHFATCTRQTCKEVDFDQQYLAHLAHFFTRWNKRTIYFGFHATNEQFILVFMLRGIQRA
jgi:hypothetical protein